MVNLLIGPKGSRKTQKMFELANEAVKDCNGDIVFIKRSHRETSNLSHKMRVIFMSDYEAIANVDEYIGFLYGLLSCNHDIEAIYIDGLLKHANITPDNLNEFIERVKKISISESTDFYVSCSVTKEELGDVEDCVILN